jgi:cysteinyl-tRNA synthetase
MQPYLNNGNSGIISGMALKLYNTMTRKKEVFTPADPNRVTMYNCGPTVYSHAHIGNARAAVVADVLFRVLRHIYGDDHVVYARNITDVEDKIIATAKELGVEISEITEKYARIYNEDLAALNCLQPTHQPKATDNISGMIAIIEKLIADGYAYESDGHVFFDVSTFKDYGKLSGNTLDALKGGDRVGEGETDRKKNAADFVLWKPPLDGVAWEAPFGAGRPGWHIECSAMAKEVLDETIDIHCGGIDLKFPHHENEIAQSECAHGKTMARYWVHNNFLNMGAEKMSKSIGNIKLISDILEDWDGEVVRLALLKAHYRSELIWTEDLLEESKAQLDGIYRGLMSQSPDGDQTIDVSMLLDDLNTPEALANLSVGVAKLLGLLQKDPEDWFKGDTSDDDEARIDALIAERLQSRADKNWARGDEIRDQLAAEGIVLEDAAGGTTWRRE